MVAVVCVAETSLQRDDPGLRRRRRGQVVDREKAHPEKRRLEIPAAVVPDLDQDFLTHAADDRPENRFASKLKEQGWALQPAVV